LDNSHACRLSGVFFDVHAAGKNGISIYLRLAAQTLRGFFDKLKRRSQMAPPLLLLKSGKVHF
jgi:hypothetical protein